MLLTNVARLVALVVVCAGLDACATVKPCTIPGPTTELKDAPRLTEEPEHSRGVADRIETRPRFHQVAVQGTPSPSPTVPFFLLSIEKPRGEHQRPYCSPDEADCGGAPRFDPKAFRPELLKGRADTPDDQADAVKATVEDLNQQIFGNPRSLVLTDLARFDPGSPACHLYNVYGATAATPWCAGGHLEADTSNANWPRRGWAALPLLREQLAEVSAEYKPTHIILMSTGWNTSQAESLLDYKFLIQNLVDQSGSVPIRPIVIGVAWESEWSGAILSRIPFSSVFTKGNDADEIGFTWMNVVLNDVLQPVADQAKVPMIAIGHSYGSRIVLGAHYLRSIKTSDDGASAAAPGAPSRTLIGMQAAFPTGRFIARYGKEHPYLQGYKGDALVAITTSSHDKATSTFAFGTTGYIGGQGGIDQVTGDRKQAYENIRFVDAGPGTIGSPPPAPLRSQINLYDASTFVACELQETGSGAHSDIYDPEMGYFLNAIIRDAAR